MPDAIVRDVLTIMNPMVVPATRLSQTCKSNGDHHSFGQMSDQPAPSIVGDCSQELERLQRGLLDVRLTTPVIPRDRGCHYSSTERLTVLRRQADSLNLLTMNHSPGMRLGAAACVAFFATACGRRAPVVRTRFNPTARRHVIMRESLHPTGGLKLQILARLGGPRDSASNAATAPIGTRCSVAGLANGDFVTSSAVGGGELIRYDSAGHWSGTLGRPGSGPGEFGPDLSLRVGKADTLRVLDDSNLRAVTLAPSGKLEGSFRLPMFIDSWDYLGGRWIVHSHANGSNAPAPLFRILDATGKVVKAFGASSVRLGEGDWWIVSAGRDGGFWTARIWSYQLYHWTGAAHLTDTYVRKVSWFPTSTSFTSEEMNRWYRQTPPPAGMTHIREDDRRRLWVFVVLPDKAWKPGPPHFTSPDWYRREFDTEVEVISVAHPTAPHLLASERFDDVLAPLCGGSNRMFRVIETSTGDSRLEILRPVLTQ